jgi:hypothetical protein
MCDVVNSELFFVSLVKEREIAVCSFRTFGERNVRKFSSWRRNGELRILVMFSIFSPCQAKAHHKNSSCVLGFLALLVRGLRLYRNIHMR